MLRSFHLPGAAKTVSVEAAGCPTVAQLAVEPGVRDCLRWLAERRQWINELHLELCRIPAPTFREQQRSRWMAEQLRALGWEVKVDRAGNVLGFMDGQREGPLVALTAHLDTVLAPRVPEDITVLGDGRFQGPGVADNGAGLAALVAIAAAVKAAPPDRDSRMPLLLVANVGEEGEGNLSGMRYLCSRSALGRKIGAFVVLDGPSTDRITSQALASRRFEISFAGPGGHSWSDYGAGNPVHALSRAISLFVDARTGAAGALRSSFNFGTIEGGTSVNSIPTSARSKVDLRGETAGAMEDMAAQLSAAVERALEVENQRATGARLAAKIREIGSRPGGKLADDAQILGHLRAVDAFLSIRSQTDCSSTDANIPLSLGLAAVSIGAGGQGGGAHTPNEWYHPEGREVALRRILLLVCLLMRAGPGTPP